MDGPGRARIDLGDCQFSLDLGEGQHVRYNGPDVVLYQSTQALPSDQLPWLWQAPMSHGYFWSFRKRGSLDTRWFGLMCETTDDFPWSPTSDEAGQPSPELQSVMDDNAQRCPAAFKQGRWLPTRQARKGVFRNLSGPGWSGVLLALPAGPSRLGSLSFCLVHRRQVLIGAVEDDRRQLAVPADFMDPLVRTLSSIRFEDAAH